MLNFTVGPVQAGPKVLAIGSQQVPYFRTPEFSEMMLENERLMLRFSGAPEGSRAVFLTGSGTAAMESAVMNILSADDRAVIVDGGGFGYRFCQLCDLHGVPYDRISLAPGTALREEHLVPYEGCGYSAFVVNIHETSTGVLYDIGLISEFCKRNDMLLVVDAISSFLADEIDMDRNGVDAMIVGSQKALACPPGVSVVIMSRRALARIQENPSRCMYLDLRNALQDAARGQTPFTPAVSTLLQINARLREIERAGGAVTEIARTRRLAEDFRGKIADLPLDIPSESMSNAVTPLAPKGVAATDVFTRLKDEFGIWVCPNGGELAQTVFRVGHLGALTPADNTVLVSALSQILRGGGS